MPFTPPAPNPPPLLRLNAGLAALSPDGLRFALRLGRREYLAEDGPIPAILKRLQNPCSAPDLLAHLAPDYAPNAIASALEELLAERIIVESAPHTNMRRQAAFWDMAGLHGPREPLKVVSLLAGFESGLVSLLGASGVTISEEARAVVLVADDLLRPEIVALCEASERVLLVQPLGAEFTIGPVISTGTVCIACLSHWLRLRRWPELALAGRIALTAPPATLPASMTLATGMAATVAALWSSAQEGPYEHALCIVSLLDLTITPHPVVPRANCGCGPASPLRTNLRARVHALGSPETGLLDEVRISNGPIGGPWLAHAVVLQPLPSDENRSYLRPIPVDGKAPAEAEARERCALEAIERYSATYAGTERIHYAAASELSQRLFPGELSQWSETQWARTGSFIGSAEIPARYNDEHTGWVQAQPILDGTPIWVPAEYVYLWFPQPSGKVFHFADTNGCAAAFTLDQAKLHALLELVERDALAIWWYNRIARPAVDLEQWGHADALAADRLFAAQGRPVTLFDITGDLGLPVYAAVSGEASGARVLLACAAGVCAETAALSALRELIQFWYWTERSPTGGERSAWMELLLESRQPHLAASSGVAASPAQNLQDPAKALGACVAALQRAGLHAYCVDLTRPDIGVPAVRAVVPGLRHHGPRFAPGRLYSAPVAQGWRDRPLREEDLNPVPVYL